MAGSEGEPALAMKRQAPIAAMAAMSVAAATLVAVESAAPQPEEEANASSHSLPALLTPTA